MLDKKIFSQFPFFGDNKEKCKKTKAKSIPKTISETINLNDKEFSYQIKRSNRRKSLTLTIDKRGLIAHAPVRVAHSRIVEFINQKTEWIVPRLEEFQKYRKPDYSQIYIYGQSFLIKTILDNRPLQNNQIDYVEKIVWLIDNSADKKNIKIQVQKILSDLAKNEITKRLPFFAGKMGVNSPLFKISKAETRWGSCSVSGELSFSWKLACVYPMLIDYVIVHELAHLTHMNHSARFWNLVAKHYPAYKLARTNMREFELKLIDY